MAIMGKRITPEQREAVLNMLAQGQDRDTIAVILGVSPGQVSAVSAHVTMGTYHLPQPGHSVPNCVSSPSRAATDVLQHWDIVHAKAHSKPTFPPVLLGLDAETQKSVYWNPDPDTGAANPHVLILGESGFGKTYTICCLLAELAERGVHSLVFDYGRGSRRTPPPRNSSSG